jgi:hypothetical protein
MSSLLALTNPRDVITGGTAFVGPEASLLDIISLSFANTRNNFNVNSSASSLRSVNEDQAKLFEDLTGESVGSLYLGNRRASKNRAVRNQIVDERIVQLRTEDPETYGGLMTSTEQQAEARRRAVDSAREYEQAFEYTDGIGKYIASFAGAIGGSFTDPIQASTALLTAGYGVGPSFLRAAAIEAGIGAGTELLLQPEIARWQNEIGNKYGFKQVASSVLLAGVIGAGISVPATAATRLRGIEWSNIFEQASQAEGLSNQLRVALSEVSRAFTMRDIAASPDIARNTANHEAVVLAAEQNRPVRLDEIDARITDDIDGIPAQAFRFLDPDNEIPIRTTLLADGEAAVSTTRNLRIKDLNKEQLRAVVESEILPLIRRELLDDAQRFVRDEDNIKNLQQQSRTLHGRIATLRKQFSRSKRDALAARDRAYEQADKFAERARQSTKGSRDTRDRKAAQIRSQLRLSADRGYNTAIRNADRQFTDQSLSLEQQAARYDGLVEAHQFNQDRIKIADEIGKGRLPQGDEYFAVTTRNTIDRIVAAAQARRQLRRSPERQSEVVERLQDMGFIERPVRQPDDVLEEVKNLDADVEEAFVFARNELEQLDPTIRIFDDEGNETTLGRLLNNESGEAEVTAVRSCATGAA